MGNTAALGNFKKFLCIFFYPMLFFCKMYTTGITVLQEPILQAKDMKNRTNKIQYSTVKYKLLKSHFSIKNAVRVEVLVLCLYKCYTGI